MDELRDAHYEQAEEKLEDGHAEMLLHFLQDIEKTKPSPEVLALITKALEEIVSAPKNCEYQTYSRSLEGPAEYCEEITVADSDYCKKHD